MIVKMELTHTSEMEIDLSLIDASDLFEELEERGYKAIENEFLMDFLEKARRKEPIESELATLFYNTIGRIL
jgi:hypothetical protein